MKSIYYILISLLLTGCGTKNVNIKGTANGLEGGAVTILDIGFKTVFGASIKSGKFDMKQQPIDVPGYYTFSVLYGSYPRDFEIYLEPGTYTIDIPQKETDYLKITTNSATQNKLSAYYNFENNAMAKYRREDTLWEAKLNDPKIKDLPEAEFQNIMDHIANARKREHGLHLTAMDMFIKKYPQNDIVPHIMTNMGYQKDPQAYYTLYKKLSPEVQNSEDGKKVGEELQRLIGPAASSNVH